MRKSDAIFTEMSWLNKADALLATYSEGSLSFAWLAGLGFCPQEVLMATHVEFQAEVAGRSERAELALKGLSPVLVLMNLTAS